MLVLLSSLLLPAICSRPAAAAVTLVQKTNNNVIGTSTSFSSAPAAGDLLVVICASNGPATITGPAGFSSAINESTTIAQGIFYKFATGSGETTLSCSFTGSYNTGVQLYDYRGLHTYMTLEGTSSNSASSGTTLSTGTLTTTHANDLLVIAGVSNNQSAIGTWSGTGSFTSENNFYVTSGPKTNRSAYAGADQVTTSAGTYSASASVGSAEWRGQIVAFRAMAASPTLTADIVDGIGNPVANPSVSLTSVPVAFTCQTTSGTLGSAAQKIRVNNATDNPAWSLAIAATAGPTATWQNGGKSYAFNNPAGGGCSTGQLTVDAAAGTITPQTNCPTTGLATGTGTFSSGTTDAITLLSAGTSAYTDCYWDLAGITLSQKVPAGQPSGSYSLNLTLTITAN